MAVKLFLSNLRAQYEAMRNAGKKSVTTDDLIKHFDNILATPLDSKYQDYEKALHETNMEMFKSVIEAGLNAIKSALILNGGASVAMLAFIGHLSESRPNSVAVMAPTILPFALGAFSAGLTSGGRYLDQFCYGHDNLKWGNILTGFCIFFGVASYLAFLIGIFLVYIVLTYKL